MLDPGTKFSDRLNTNFNSYGFINYAEFGAEKKLIGDEDSGISSPPLWRTSPRHRQTHYRSLSPSSRAQAIARGQKEMMEMVSRMPEGCYELSLKDIVEQSMVNKDEVKEESFSKQRNGEDREKEKKTNDRKVRMNRSESIDNGGFLLKMVFPISFGSRKKKKVKSKNNDNSNISDDNKTGMNNSGRVSPRPLLMDGSGNRGENEWWKNRISEVEESESGGFSSNSGSSKSSGSSSSRSSSRNSTSRNGGNSCWSFIFRKRGKKAK